MTARLHEALQGEVPAPVRLRREARQAAWDASRAGFPARPDQAEWLATRLGHDAVLGLITRPPFTASNPGTRNGQIRGVNLALDWLVSHPGGTWQKRWLASGAEDTGKDWKQDCAAWMDTRGVRARQRMDLLSVGLILGICAGIVRPGLHWLAASGVSPCALGRNLERTRDQSGLSRLRAVLGDGTVAAGARHATIGRAAIIMAAKGGTLAEIAAGDFLELLDAERAARGRPRDYSAVSWRLMRQAGAFGQRAPESLAQLLTIGQRLASRHTLVSVRAFYLDLACWAAGDPARWGQWAVPSPVSKADTENRKEDRRRKSRMDSRTRERLPVLTRSAAGHRDRTDQTLTAALAVPPGATFTASGQSFTRAAPRKAGIRTRAHNSDGSRHDLTREEDHAFWTRAIIEVLRATGIFSRGANLDIRGVFLVSPGQ